jgi:hypothetical protein
LSTVCQLHDLPGGTTLRALRPFGSLPTKARCAREIQRRANYEARASDPDFPADNLEKVPNCSPNSASIPSSAESSFGKAERRSIFSISSGSCTRDGESPVAERTAHSGSGKTPSGRPSKPGPVSRSIGTTRQPVHRRDS